jgi:hypothetical protein
MGTRWYSEIFKVASPFDDGGFLKSLRIPKSTAIPIFPDSPQEFSPGLDTELKK